MTQEENSRLNNRVSELNSVTEKFDSLLNENLNRAQRFTSLQEEISKRTLSAEEKFENDLVKSSDDFAIESDKISQQIGCIEKVKEELEQSATNVQDTDDTQDSEPSTKLIKEFEKISQRIAFDSPKEEVNKIETTVNSTVKDYEHVLTNIEEKLSTGNKIKEFVVEYEETKEKLMKILENADNDLGNIDTVELQQLIKKISHLAKKIKIPDFEELCQKASKKIAQVDTFMKAKETKDYKKQIDERKFSEVKLWVDQALLENDKLDNDSFTGDVAMIRAVMRQNKKNNDTVEHKKIIIEEMMFDEDCYLSQQNGEAEGEALRVIDKCDQLIRIFSDRDFALITANQAAEEFETSINEILHWIKDTEKKLEEFQMTVDNGDFKNLETIQFEMEEISIAQKHNMLEQFEDTIQTGEDILSLTRFDESKEQISKWLNAAKSGWADLNSWVITLSDNLEQLALTRENYEKTKIDLKKWLLTKLDLLKDDLSKPLPEANDANEGQHQDEILFLLNEHEIFQEEFSNKKLDLDKINSIEMNNELNYLWEQVLINSFDRHRILQEAKQRFEDGFDYQEWQRRFVQWSKNNREGTILDIFKKMDETSTGILTREQFSNSLNLARFPTSDIEVKHILNILDTRKKDQIDYYDFIMNLQKGQTKIESQLIEDEVVRKVAGCKCKCRYHLEKVAEGQYKFGESQFLRLVRILRSTVMVRVGGGWVSLDEYLAKNDPCRGKYSLHVYLYLFPWLRLGPRVQKKKSQHFLTYFFSARKIFKRTWDHLQFFKKSLVV